jgi:DNA polymerase-3 subunit gamma/tau
MDKFIVSARKYRPASFTDVVGQPSITTTLRNSIKNNLLGHAYLFSGPRGVGKTTCARIFAKTINCENISESAEACNKCESCLSFNENRSYSIHELDAASNNSVDDIRTLTEQVRIPPQIGSYSIYIIDEVHMLSQAAFNAFLKTLEEPPAHAIFVLATTEKHKIIPTILSRCQIFDFNRIKVEDAVEYLKLIASRENLEAEEDALHMIAHKADGAMRDALSIFDQVVSFSGEKITYQGVIENLNILDYEYFFRLTFSFLEGDVATAMLIFDEILSKGFDPRNFINGYAAHLRDLMVCKDPETVKLMEVGAGIREKYLAQSGQVSLAFIYEGLEICNQADIQFRASRNQRLSIELALVKLANLSGVSKKKTVTDLPAEDSAQAEIPEAETRQPDVPQTETVQPDVPQTEVNPADLPGDSAPAKEVGNGASRTIRNAGISIKESLRKPIEPAQAAETEGELKESEDTGPAVSSEKENMDGTAAITFSPEAIQGAWKEYASSLEKSKPRIFSTLSSNQPVVGEDGLVRVYLNSEAQRDNFNKNIKSDLLRYIKSHAGISRVEIIAEVSESEDNGKKIYTEQDKLDFLIKKNPELGMLKSRFNLDFDD